MTKEQSADDVLALARSYQPACVLVAAAELDLFATLAHDALRAEEVAKKLTADPRATTMLLDALVSIGLMEKQNDRYVLPPSTAQLLRKDSSTSVLSMLQHQANCVRKWGQLASVVVKGKPARRRPSIRGEERDEEAFIGAMDVVCAPVASQIVEELGPPVFRHMLDVGGASGTWTIAFLRAQPDATATLFDLPHVIPLADRRISEAKLSDRVKLIAGDFLTDPLPAGADLAWISAIVHQNSREQNRQLFGLVAECLTEDGQVLIRDVLMDGSRTTPAAGALFAIHMLLATEAGGTFTFNELREDLEDAGFTGVQVLRRDDGMNSIIGATKAHST